MTVVSPQQVNPNDDINASSVNNPVNQLAAVINGNIDSSNISTIDGSKVTSGTITPVKITNPYKFSAYLTNAFNLSTGGVDTKIPFNSKKFDTNNNYDNTTNFRYTVPVSGFYQIDAHLHTGVIGATRRIILKVFKNGSFFEIGDENTRADQTIGISYSSTVQLVAGDYIEIFCYSNDSQVMDNSPGLNRFSGFLVSQN